MTVQHACTAPTDRNTRTHTPAIPSSKDETGSRNNIQRASGKGLVILFFKYRIVCDF